jgi:hypothetical protein
MMLLVKFPTRGRPQKFLETFKKYIDMADDQTNIFFMITLDSNDTTVTMEFIDEIIKMHPNVRVDVGISGSKIRAVNRDMETAPYFDILLLASDDMVPVVKGYDTIIRKNMPPSTDAVLWFNDGHQGNGLNTLCILGRTYYRRFGYIYHPSYVTMWCDNEFTCVANLLGKQSYFDQIIIEHQHPNFGIGVKDNTYIQNDVGHDNDKKIFMHRKNIMFDLKLGITSLPIVPIRIK